MKRLNDAKIRLDRIDGFLTDVQMCFPKKPVREDSILAKLPLPSVSTPKPSVSARGLTIIPPEPDEMSPSLISTALLPINASETARTSALDRTMGPTPTCRHVGAATTALHEELSSQLEDMARQLKRNALHFSASLANDKAVIEEAAAKIEGNFGVMEGQRMRLRDRTRSGSCLTMGIILLVIVIFVVMVMVIRLS